MAQVLNRNGSNLIKILVILFDFIIINAILLTLIKLTPSVVPSYILNHSRLTIMLANFAMIISQSEYSTILHLRNTSFLDAVKQSCKLTYSHALILFLSLRLLSNGGNLFDFMILYSITCHIIIVCARCAEHNLLKFYRKSGGNITSVIFVGNDYANAEIYNKLMEDISTGYRVLGYFADKNITGVSSNFIRLGSMSDLNDLMEDSLQVSENDKKELSKELINNNDINSKNFQLSGVQEIFCCLSHDENEEIKRIMHFCDKNVIHFHYVPRQFGNYQLDLKPEQLGEFRLYTNRKEPLLEIQNYALKRAFDIVFSGCVCLCLLPFLPIIALIIKLQSPGPIFFKQARTGSDGRIFDCIKFRSMHVNADADRIQATKNDPRKFAFGNFMRKTNIDELPQFFNVLKGDMSIVGPRPQLVRDMVFMTEEQRLRHKVRPGLTGLAQVNGRNAIAWEDKFKYDLQYIKRITLFRDIKILFQTVFKVLKRSDVVREGTVSDMDYGDYLLQELAITQEEYNEKKEKARELAR